MKLVKTKNGTFSFKGLNEDALISLWHPLNNRGGLRSDDEEKLYILIGDFLQKIGYFSS